MKPSSLDELISKKAEEFADQVRAAAAIADKEEEIRIEVEKQLAFVQQAAGVKLQGKHEFTVVSGRIDSVYNRVIIEYKNPASPGARIGPGANSPGAKKVVEQIKSRFYDLRSKETLNTLFGVGCDGNHFIFVRYYNDKWQVQDPVEVNKHSAERFLWALFNLGTRGKRFEPDYLAGDFGSSEGSVASSGIKILYDAISTTTNPKAETFFNQWKILFGEVCGYDVDNPSDKIKKLAAFYGVPSAGVKPAEMLFAVHTYYALFMKLLAGEIIGHFHKVPSLLQKLINAPNATKLKDVLDDLENRGGIFKHLGITNFLEGDLFAWYLPAWSDEIEDLVRKMTARLDQYNPGTLAEEPAESRDMLKKLYQQLFPKSVRHDLGEYYTPDWLAEHVLNELGYAGDPDKRILDPACGSGTFLVMAITRIRAWYEKNRETLRYDERELCKKILANVVGFDLNPLAVMAARTNYLIAIRDLVSHIDKVEIPVYLCDSILTPSTYGGLFAGTRDAVKELETAAATFLIPTEIASSADDVAAYAEQLEAGVRDGLSEEEFLQSCRDASITIKEEKWHRELYAELLRLDRERRNGVWARIIKNSFAPLFQGRFDFIAGNPPWIRWGYLPENYRDKTKPLWIEYGLFSLSGAEAQLGSGEKDFSQLFAYACIDFFLDDGGRLGFVITQTVFKSKGQAQGFRRFQLGKKSKFQIRSVDDFVSIKPFEAGNLTVTFTAEKGVSTDFPVPYRVWSKRDGCVIDQGDELSVALAKCDAIPQVARPLPGDDTNQWMTATEDEMLVIQRILGSTPYKAERGAGTDPYTVFQVRPLRRASSDKILIENFFDAPRAKIRAARTQGTVEYDLLYPISRGEDIDRWHARTGTWLLMTQNPETRLGYERGTMLKRYRGSFEYISRFKNLLEARKSKFVRRLMERSGFWAMYGISENTVSDHKVMWRRMGNKFQAAVASLDSIFNLPQKHQVPSDTVSYVACSDVMEAHYLCALMNSAPVRRTIMAYSAPGRGFGAPVILNSLAIPRFDAEDKVHVSLAKSSMGAHAAAARDAHDDLRVEEANVDRLSAELFRLSPSVLVHVQQATAIIENVKIDIDDEDSSEE